jgi:hypothetical protein
VKRDGSVRRIFVHVADEPEDRQLFPDFNERPKARFQQIDTRVTTDSS